MNEEITYIGAFTEAVVAGYKPTMHQWAELLYAAQAQFSNSGEMLWLTQTPESLADEIIKAMWLAGTGPRPISALNPPSN